MRIEGFAFGASDPESIAIEVSMGIGVFICVCAALRFLKHYYRDRAETRPLLDDHTFIRIHDEGRVTPYSLDAFSPRIPEKTEEDL